MEPAEIGEGSISAKNAKMTPNKKFNINSYIILYKHNVSSPLKISYGHLLTWALQSIAVLHFIPFASAVLATKEGSDTSSVSVLLSSATTDRTLTPV